MTPDGAKILGTLIDLYADQMGVKIKHEIVKERCNNGKQN